MRRPCALPVRPCALYSCPWRPPPLSPGLHRTPRSVAFTSRYHTVPSSIILCWSGLVQPRADHARFCCFSSSSRVMCVEEQQHQHCGCIDSAGQPRLKRTPTNTPRSLEQGASTGIDRLTWVLSYLGCCMESNQRFICTIHFLTMVHTFFGLTKFPDFSSIFLLNFSSIF